MEKSRTLRYAGGAGVSLGLHVLSRGGVLYGMRALLTSPLSDGSKAQLWQHGSVPTSCSLSPVFHCCGWDNGEECPPCLSDEPLVHASRGGRPKCCIAWMFQESRLGIGSGRGIVGFQRLRGGCISFAFDIVDLLACSRESVQCAKYHPRTS